MSRVAFSTSCSCGVACPVTASPFATLRCRLGMPGFHDVLASSHSLTAGVPSHLIGGRPQIITVIISNP